MLLLNFALSYHPPHIVLHPLPNKMSHQQSSNTVTIPDSPLGFWDEQLWIGKNKKYPASETPSYILAAWSEVAWIFIY